MTCAPSGCPSRPTASSRRQPRMFVGAKDMHYVTADGRKVLDGTAGLWCCQCRPLPAQDHRGDPATGGGTRLRAGLPDGPPQGLRAGQPAGRPGSRRSRPCPLHQFRIGIGRDRAQDRPCLSPREGRRLALPPDRARARLSRRQFRRHLGRRHRRQPQDVRHPAHRCRPHAAHPHAGAERVHARRA